LNDPAFASDREAVIARALEACAMVIDVGTDRETSRASLQIARTHGRVFSTVGVHPHEARHYVGPALDEVLALADEQKVVALGEMGLDFHYDLSPRAAQREVFARQLEASRPHRLPVVVHVREAYDVAFGLMQDAGWPAGVLHCFTGTWPQARTGLDHGLYVSLSGIVTFKNAGELSDVAARLPADRLLVETDSPYLSPVPLRGRRNEPAHLGHTLARIAAIRGVDAEDLASQTAANARSLFGLPEVAA
jgi:TatD DNase family protein